MKNIITTKEEFDELVKKPRKYIRLAKSKKLVIEYKYPEKYEALVHAIGIPNRKERITYIYDNACDVIDKYNEDNGLICSFKDNRCLDKSKGGRYNGCCYRCKYQSSRGCPSKNLACKFYFCARFIREHKKPLCFEDFPEFMLLTGLQQEMIKTNAYCKRETFLNLLLLDNFLIFYIYSALKIFNLIIYERKNKLEKL